MRTGYAVIFILLFVTGITARTELSDYRFIVKVLCEEKYKDVAEELDVCMRIHDFNHFLGVTQSCYPKQLTINGFKKFICELYEHEIMQTFECSDRIINDNRKYFNHFRPLNGCVENVFVRNKLLD